MNPGPQDRVCLAEVVPDLLFHSGRIRHSVHVSDQRRFLASRFLWEPVTFWSVI